MRRAGHVALPSLVALILCAGCAPWATYPPVEYGGETLTHPTFDPIPILMALAIRHAHTEYGGPAEIIVNLPPGAGPKAYDRVIEFLGEGRPMTARDQVAYHVTEVRTRAFDSEVDLIYPRADGACEFATLSFKTNLVSGHRVTDTRTWRIRFDTPGPNYVAPEVAPDPAGATANADI